MIVNPTLCGSCYWEINSDGVFSIYGSDEDVTEYVLDAWDDTPPWYEYRAQIKTVSITSDIVYPQTLHKAFYGCSTLKTVVIGQMNLSYCANLACMFQGCVNLSSLELTNFDTSSVTTMAYMFYNCQSLTTLDLSGWDTSNVTTMASMFYRCEALASLDLSGWDTSNVTNMLNMFRMCYALASLDLSDFNVSAITATAGMFYACTSLTTIYATEWTDEAVNITLSGQMFYKCTSLVGAISYDSSKVGIAYANTITGYFTAVGADTGGDTDDDTTTGGVTVEGGTVTIAGTVRKVTDLPTLDIYYESASGDVVDFNGDALWIQEPEALFKGLWEYDSYDSAYGGGKITRFYRPVEESDEVSLEVVADSYAEYTTIVDNAHDIFEADIRNLTAGKLWINGAYRECYIHSRSYEDFDIVLASAAMDVSALYTGESWINELILEAADIAEAAGTLADGTDIMRPVDVDVSSPAYLTLNLELTYPVYPVITFYGPAENPWITIGSNFYQVRQTIYEGESIVYDAKNRTIAGYIETAREPDSNSYSEGVPEGWEPGDTLYRAAMFALSDGSYLFIGPQTSYAAGEGYLDGATVTINDVLLSAESEVTWGDEYVTVSDEVTLGSGNEDTGTYQISYAKVFDGWKSVFDSTVGWAVSGFAAQVSAGPSFADFVAEEDLSNIYLAHWHISLEDLGLSDYDAAEIGFALINSDCDYVIIHVKTDTTTSGNLRLEISEADGMVSGTVDLSDHPDYLILYFRSSEPLSSGEQLTICCGYITGEGSYPVTGQMIYANEAVGKKNWFEYRNLDMDPFEPVEPGEHTVYFESDLSFDLTILEERSEPPWST